MSESDTQRIEDFIFVRELNEVFLLLDHISGRWDKSLYASGVVDDGSPHLDELVAIGLSRGDDSARVDQAVTLLRAKDKLNAAARPATGLTIAFTLLVVGEDNRRDWKSWVRNFLRNRAQGRAHAHAAAAVAGVVDAAGAASPSGPSGPSGRSAVLGSSAVPGSPGSPGSLGPGSVAPVTSPVTSWSPHGPYWDKPTRLTLARYAFPGLVKMASRFKRRIGGIVAVLVLLLTMTCMMSWHVTGGNVILQHLDALKLQQVALDKSISEAELKFAGEQRVHVQFCAGTYRNTEEYQLCTRRGRIDNQLQAVRANLRIWLQPWKACYSWASGWITSAPVRGYDDAQRRGTEELARIVTMVVGTSVLPLCYGILGAGAAVVRGLWAKMRESLLSPRDYTLALLQLALGATIGACIGLFVNPAGPGGESGLFGNWALSSSALSFIAGFGVEGVFLALESLVRRVFNIAEPRS